MVRGKSFTGMLAAIGECIMICKPKTNARRKGDSLWEVGVFLGKTENNLFLTGMHGEVRASRSAKRLADDYRGELVESVKTYPWQIKQSVPTTKVVPRRVLPGPAPVPALPGNPAPGGAIEDAGPGKDEADPSSSQEQGSQRNAAGIGSSSSNSTELRPSLEDVTVEVDDTAMPEAVNSGPSGRDERPILEQSPRTPKAPRKELHPPFLKLKKHFRMKMRFWNGLKRKMISLICLLELMKMSSATKQQDHQIYLKKIFKLWREILCKKKFTDYR